MTKSELIQRLAHQHRALSDADITASINIILDAIVATLAIGNRVEIRGFGSFGLNRRPPRIGRNPRTGDRVDVPAKYVPHFRPGKELRERVSHPAGS